MPKWIDQHNLPLELRSLPQKLMHATTPTKYNGPIEKRVHTLHVTLISEFLALLQNLWVN